MLLENLPALKEYNYIHFLCVVTSQGIQTLLVVPSSLWSVQRRTWSTCGHYTTSLAATRKTFRSRRGRSSSSWRSQRNSGGVPKAKMDVSGWSLCPMWRNWYDPRPTLASPPMDLATPTAMGSLSPPTRSFMPTPSPRHLLHCPLARLAQSSLLYPPCRMAQLWPRPSRNECPAPMIKQLLLLR